MQLHKIYKNYSKIRNRIDLMEYSQKHVFWALPQCLCIEYNLNWRQEEPRFATPDLCRTLPNLAEPRPDRLTTCVRWLRLAPFSQVTRRRNFEVMYGDAPQLQWLKICAVGAGFLAYFRLGCAYENRERRLLFRSFKPLVPPFLFRSKTGISFW